MASGRQEPVNRLIVHRTSGRLTRPGVRPHHGAARFIRTTGALALSLGMLVGCSHSRPHGNTHTVKISEYASAFHQTREIHSLSTTFFTDSAGNLWPRGTTLSANATQFENKDTVWLKLEFRHDELIADDDSNLDVMYARAQTRRQDLSQSCTHITLNIDGEQAKLPVLTHHVQVLTNRTRMPIPATDSAPDPVAEHVATLPPTTSSYPPG